jgi:RsiW-degrading membrane proteinase PrsW (M82 family)
MVLLLGAFIVPVAFVAFFYGQERAIDKLVHVEAPLRIVAACFFVGGIIGVVTAGFLEYATLTKLTISGLFIVGLIEESAKLIFPIAIYIRAHYRSEADGLLFGVASGMGFAALETMGYGLVSLMQSGGNVGILEGTLLIRGLLSPVGHAAWTGLICATLWRQRERTGKLFNPSVIWVFVLAVVLHALWDIAGLSQQAFISYPGYVIIGGISLMLLIRKLREARRSIV